MTKQELIQLAKELLEKLNMLEIILGLQKYSSFLCSYSTTKSEGTTKSEHSTKSECSTKSEHTTSNKNDTSNENVTSTSTESEHTTMILHKNKANSK